MVQQVREPAVITAVAFRSLTLKLPQAAVAGAVGGGKKKSLRGIFLLVTLLQVVSFAKRCFYKKKKSIRH